MEKKQIAADEKLVTPPATLQAAAQKAVRREPPVEEVESGQSSHVEYTELALDCLDLKAQQELLSPSLPAGENDAWITFDLKSPRLQFSFHCVQF